MTIRTTTGKTRWGLLGGTFDPIHLGHLILAEDAIRFANLERVLFIPAYTAPLRDEPNTGSAEERMKMLRLAIEDYPLFDLCDYELLQQRKVYTLDTVRYLHKNFPEIELYFLLGEDQHHKLNQWHRIAELARLVTFVCAQRKQTGKEDLPTFPGLRWMSLPSRRVDISATEVRNLLQAQQSVTSLVSPKVAAFIEEKGLYKK